ncbi:MAG: hypothetical protein AAFN93_22940 [Bacteroidota bacterium]
MNNQLIIKLAVFVSGCLFGGIMTVYFWGNEEGKAQYVTNDKKYVIENFEDGAVRKEGFITEDSLFISYNFLYYRYPIERLSAIRCFVETKHEKIHSNLGRSFYYMSFDTAGFLTQFAFFENGKIKNQHDFQQTTRVPIRNEIDIE